MIASREDGDSYIIDFCDLEDWNGFERIFDLLSEKFIVEIRNKIDGPESRIWHFDMDGVPVSLHNNPYGNYLKGASAESVDYLKGVIDKIRFIFY